MCNINSDTGKIDGQKIAKISSVFQDDYDFPQCKYCEYYIFRGRFSSFDLPDYCENCNPYDSEYTEWLEEQELLNSGHYL